MPSILDTHPDVAAQWHPTKNTIKPEDVSAGCHKKVWWLCPETCSEGCKHEWEAVVYNRCGNESRCPYCSGNKICIHSSIVTTHPEIALQWHPAKNNIKPKSVSAGSNKKIWWLCPETCSEGCKHEWETTIEHRCMSESGCPHCSNRKICIHTSIVSTHPEIAAEWHPKKNIIKPETVSAGSNKKVWWLCPNTCSGGCKHEWEATIYDRCESESGCPYCVNQKICIHTSIATTNPQITAQWHPTKNTIRPEDVSAGSNKKVWWLCHEICSGGCKHEWEATIKDRYAGYGCPYCSGRTCCIHTSIATTHPIIASQWHPTKNNIGPENLSAGSGKKVWWLCHDIRNKERKHEWKAIIANRCNGTGCPTCKNKTARKLFDYIKSIFPDAISEYRANWCKNPFTNKHLPFDIYIPSLKVIIELDGAQHFRQVLNWGDTNYTQLKDVYKMHAATEQGLHIIRLIQEDVYAKPLEWLDEHLKPELVGHEGHNSIMFVSESDDVYDVHIKLYESINLVQCRDKLLEFHTSNSDECDDSDD
jgi:hypothetical protein